MRRWALVLIVGAGCLPPYHDLVGRECDEEHPCGGGELLCVLGRCAPREEPSADGGEGCVASTLPNGGFEAGYAGWNPNTSGSALELVDGRARSGAKALRVYAAGAASYLGTDVQHVSGVAAGETWCVRVWAQRGTITGRMSLIARRWGASNSWQDTPWAELPTASVVPVDDQWFRLVSRTTLTADYQTAVNFRLYTGWVDGGEFLVDDVRLWLDPAGTCEEPGQAPLCSP